MADAASPFAHAERPTLILLLGALLGASMMAALLFSSGAVITAESYSRTPVRGWSFGGEDFVLPPEPAAPSNSSTPSLSSTPSPTPSLSSTPSPTPTPSVTPSVPPPGPNLGDCSSLLNEWMLSKWNRSRLSNLPYSFDALTWDVARAAPEYACGPEAAGAALAAFQYRPEQVCYVALASDDATARAAQWNGWGNLVARFWSFGAAADPDSRTEALPEIASKAGNRRMIAVLKAAFAKPGAAECKWWVVANEKVWVNPRVVLQLVRGLDADAVKLGMGWVWHGHGFTTYIDALSNGNGIYSKAAMDAIVPALGTPECPGPDELGLPSDDVAVARCFHIQKVLFVATNQADNTGALLLSGTPLEPGPPPDTMAWLQQPITRGSFWLLSDNINPSLMASMRAGMDATYAPLGLPLVGGELAYPPLTQPTAAEAGAAISPLPSVAAAAPTPGAAALTASFPALPATTAPCAAKATDVFRALLDRTRTSATAAAPIPLELAYSVFAETCNAPPALAGKVAAASFAAAMGPPPADPVTAAATLAATIAATPAVPLYTTNDLCYLVWTNTNAEPILQAWGRHVPNGIKGLNEADPADMAATGRRKRLWFATTDANLPNVPGATAFPGLGGKGDGNYHWALLKAWLALPEADRAGCAFLFVGQGDDWVNPWAARGMVRGLHADAPLSIAYHWTGQAFTGGVDRPARGRTFYSRGALAAMAAHMAAGGCPEEEGGDASVSKCAWGAGVVPIHTYLVDSAGMGPAADWAYTSPHYLLGWVVSIAMPPHHLYQIMEYYFRACTYGPGAWDIVHWEEPKAARRAALGAPTAVGAGSMTGLSSSAAAAGSGSGSAALRGSAAASAAEADAADEGDAVALAHMARTHDGGARWYAAALAAAGEARALEGGANVGTSPLLA